MKRLLFDTVLEMVSQALVKTIKNHFQMSTKIF